MDEVRFLAKRIDSDVPCVRIYGELTTDNIEGYSTEGIEAARMIYGYMKRAYPIRFDHYSKNGTRGMVTEVRTWLRKNQISTGKIFIRQILLDWIFSRDETSLR